MPESFCLQLHDSYGLPYGPGITISLDESGTNPETIELPVCREPGLLTWLKLLDQHGHEHTGPLARAIRVEPGNTIKFAPGSFSFRRFPAPECPHCGKPVMGQHQGPEPREPPKAPSAWQWLRNPAVWASA